jgi:hypothetical protein
VKIGTKIDARLGYELLTFNNSQRQGVVAKDCFRYGYFRNQEPEGN